MTLLLLGGTEEGKKLVEPLMAANIPLIYSHAGLVRTPQLPCEIISGGFSQYADDGSEELGIEGLQNYIKQNGIQLILDATHPYAAIISAHAAQASQACNIPCYRYARPAWQASAQDEWINVANEAELLEKLADYQRPFFTLGQSVSSLIEQKISSQHWLVRTTSGFDSAAIEQRSDITCIRAIGPFELSNERGFLVQHRIDVIISKNSGGHATEAKISAARELTIPVIMLQRPTLPAVTREFGSIDECVTQCSQWYEQNKTK